MSAKEMCIRDSAKADLSFEKILLKPKHTTENTTFMTESSIFFKGMVFYNPVSYTHLLAKAGYDMIGVDLSEDMLAIASGQNEEGILYLCQDMCELELYGTAKAMVSVCCLLYTSHR